MRRAVVIVLLFLAVLGLALVGQYREDPAGFAEDPSQRIYRAIQLFALEGDWTHALAAPSLEIQLARFLAPLVTVASVVLVFARGAWVAMTNVRARFARDHVVLVGLNALGWSFARSCREAGLRAVAIERNEANPYVERCRGLGVPVVVGDALASQTLRRAGVPRASHLVTFVRDDGTNVELTLHVKSLSRSLSGFRVVPLRVRCHLANVQLADRLEQYPKFFLDPHLAEISFFNVHGLAVRKLLKQQPLEVHADALRRPVNVVVLGATPLAEQVVLQIARTAHYADLELPRIAVCAENVAAERSRFERVYPGLGAAARVSFVEWPLVPDGFESREAQLPVADATAYVVCLEDDSQALSLALALRRATLLGLGLNAPVMVAMERSDGLARLLESELGTPEIPDGLYPFGMLDEIVSADTIVDERFDRLAQAFHENYLETAVVAGGDTTKRSQVPWASLPEEYRSGNRLAADHLDAKLRAVGGREDDVAEGRGGSFELSTQELDRLARMERNRFVAVRRSTGWRAGAMRSDFARIDDELVADHARSYDVAAVKEIPAILTQRLRRTLRREIVIGVTGHRLHRLPNHGDASFSSAVDATLDHIAALHPYAAFAVMSSLAEGADRLIARAAMDRLDARLFVPLPLPYELYAQDFGDSSALDHETSLAEFHDLLGRADAYVELPLEFGTWLDLARRDEPGAAARACQYALAGAYVVQRSHELIAVWDGGVHEGEGGTAQIVQWRLHGVPEPYRFPDRFFPPVEPTAPFVIPPDPDASYRPCRSGD